MHDGQWLAGITVHVTDAGGSNSVEIDMLVTADAITEAPQRRRSLKNNTHAQL